ncbi:MAG TPA: leucyl aminopeptidase [Tepidisphaeraceae bacterium]|nr:leucyl aminopeptidase [Tepidisphaeraceae bacterium]
MLPTSTNVSSELAKAVPTAADAVAVFVTDNPHLPQPTAARLTDSERQAIERMLAAGVIRGKANEVASEVVELARGKHRHVLVAGLGSAEKLTGESFRQAAAALAKTAAKRQAQNVALILPESLSSAPDVPTIVESAISGYLLASFKFTEYKGAVSKTQNNNATPTKSHLSLVVAADQLKELRPAFERARIVTDAQNYARTIASRPGNVVNPPSLATLAQDLAKEIGATCRVLDEKQMQKLNMGGILAVGSASAHPPRMIALEYRGNSRKSAAPLLVVGKAITFDAGGISIKPADKMGRMIYDKSGGVAVLGILYAVAKLKLPLHVVGILSSAENILGSESYRPGDILRMFNGVTVEVTNTDAEGRLVLADALAWGIQTYKPQAVLDLATLTGGVVVALGKTMAGFMANNDELANQLQLASQAVGEKIWRLPVGDEQRDQLKSEHADIINSAGRDGSPLQGAAFLSYFVPRDNSIPWAHLDIAGVADTEKELPYYAPGSTAWGIRTVVQWITRKAGQ